MTRPYRAAGLQLEDAQLFLALAPCRSSIEDYRSRLLAFAAVIAEELAALPEPEVVPAPAAEVMPEKVAGFISPSIHG